MAKACCQTRIVAIANCLRFTGHSLGGGLASAATIAAAAADKNGGPGGLTLSANTFNAAGLHKNTIYEDGEERVDGILTEYNREFTGAGVIKSWHLQYDLLSFLQENTDLVEALGQRHEMQGPRLKLGQRAILDALREELQANFRGRYKWLHFKSFFDGLEDKLPGNPAEQAAVISVLVNSHTTDYYGLMVIRHPMDLPGLPDVDDIWDIYGDGSIQY